MKSFIKQYAINMYLLIRFLIIAILAILSTFSIITNIIGLLVICFSEVDFAIVDWKSYILLILSIIPSITYLVTLNNYRS